MLRSGKLVTPILFIYLFISILLTACQSDNNDELVEVIETSQARVDIREVSSDEIVQNKNLSGRLKGFLNRNIQISNTKSKDAKDLIYIDSKKANLVETKGSKNYTFYAYRPSQPKLFENVIFKETANGNYKIYLISYKVNEKQYEQLASNSEVEGDYFMRIREINEQDLNFNQKSSNEDACYQYEIISLKAYEEGAYYNCEECSIQIENDVVTVIIPVDCPETITLGDSTSGGSTVPDDDSGSTGGQNTSSGSSGNTTTTVNGNNWTQVPEIKYDPVTMPSPYGDPGPGTGGEEPNLDGGDRNINTVTIQPSAAILIPRELGLNPTQTNWLFNDGSEAILQVFEDYLTENDFSLQSRSVAREIIDDITHYDNLIDTEIFSDDQLKDYHKLSNKLINIVTDNYFTEAEYLEIAVESQVLNRADREFILERKKLELGAFNFDPSTSQVSFNDATLEKVTRHETEIAVFTHIKDMAAKYWPKNSDEWQAVFHVAGPLMLDLGISFIPGSALLDSGDALAGLQTGDYFAASILVVELIMDFVPWAKLAKIGKKMYDTASVLFKIVKGVGSYMTALGKAIARGYKATHDGVTKLYRKVTGKFGMTSTELIASGDDVINGLLGKLDVLTSQQLDKFDDLIEQAAKKGQKWDSPEAVADAVRKVSDEGIEGVSLSHRKFPAPADGTDSFTLKNAKQYQAEASGDAALSFDKAGVSFDNVANGKLIDRKFGHSSVFDSAGNVANQSRADSILEQANRQLQAADGNPIRWEISSQGGANGIRNLFLQEGINIEVIHVPQITIIP